MKRTTPKDDFKNDLRSREVTIPDPDSAEQSAQMTGGGATTDSEEASSAPIAVIGLGNTLMEDEGAGVHAMELVRESHQEEERISFYDGGTKGLTLLPYMEACSRLLLIDAVESDAPAGSVLEFSRDELLRGSIPVKLSVHDIALSDLLTLLALRRGFEMKDLKLIGIVPSSMELSTELSPVVGQALPTVVRRAGRVLDGWLSELSSQEEEAACV